MAVRIHTRLHPSLGESACSTILYSHYQSPSGQDKVVEITYFAAPLGIGKFWLEITKFPLEELEAHIAKLHHKWPEAWCLEREVVCTVETADGDHTAPVAHPCNLIHLARMHGLIVNEAEHNPEMKGSPALKRAGDRLYALLRNQTHAWRDMVG